MIAYYLVALGYTAGKVGTAAGLCAVVPFCSSRFSFSASEGETSLPGMIPQPLIPNVRVQNKTIYKNLISFFIR